MSINKIEQILIKEMDKAIKEDEVPIAALIEKEGKIISIAHNKVNKTNNILNHAEILVIKDVATKINNWRLNDYNLYISLEPCSMCKEVIKKSRISNVFYFCSQNNESTEKEVNYLCNNSDIITNKLKQFFKNKR